MVLQQEGVMRSAFIIVMLIAMLIGVYLVANNLRTDSVEGAGKVESIQKAKETADMVDSAVKKRQTAME